MQLLASTHPNCSAQAKQYAARILVLLATNTGMHDSLADAGAIPGIVGNVHLLGYGPGEAAASAVSVLLVSSSEAAVSATLSAIMAAGDDGVKFAASQHHILVHLSKSSMLLQKRAAKTILGRLDRAAALQHSVAAAPDSMEAKRLGDALIAEEEAEKAKAARKKSKKKAGKAKEAADTAAAAGGTPQGDAAGGIGPSAGNGRSSDAVSAPPAAAATPDQPAPDQPAPTPPPPAPPAARALLPPALQHLSAVGPRPGGPLKGPGGTGSTAGSCVTVLFPDRHTAPTVHLGAEACPVAAGPLVAGPIAAGPLTAGPAAPYRPVLWGSSSATVRGAAPLEGAQVPPGSSSPLISRPLSLGTPAVGGSAEDDDKLCVVCMEGAASVLLTPCGHTVLCQRCCEGIRGANNQVGGTGRASYKVWRVMGSSEMESTLEAVPRCGIHCFVLGRV